MNKRGDEYMTIVHLMNTLDTCFCQDAQHIKMCLDNLQNFKGNFLKSPQIFQHPIEVKSSGEENDKICGVYLFRIRNSTPVNNDTDGFDATKYAPRLRNGEIRQFEKGCILYIGKSETDLINRINQHYVNATKNTYSLRLDDIHRRHLLKNVETIYFELKPQYIQHKKVILTCIERYMHDHIDAYVGSKKNT